MAVLARMFGAGRLPADVVSRLAGETVLVNAQSIWVSTGGSFRSPGRRQAAGARMHFGAFAVSTTEIVASISRYKVADVPFREHTDGAPVTLSVREDGLHYDIDVARSVPDGSGTFHIHFRAPIAPELLDRLPRRELSVAPNANGVVGLLRWA